MLRTLKVSIYFSVNLHNIATNDVIKNPKEMTEGERRHSILICLLFIKHLSNAFILM
jgi:hypothetical protein